MIIYRDITTDGKDEIISDTYDLKDAGDGLWEVDCTMVSKGGDNFQLEGANPSAEGEDAEEGGEAQVEKVIDIVDAFRLNFLEAKPTKKEFTGDFKAYLKKVNAYLKAQGKSDADLKKFQTDAGAALKKISANYDNYDLYLGESMTPGSLYVLIDYREDGVTPYATIFNHGLESYKV